MRISVCCITLNEEVNLRRLLSSCCEIADEIVVLDSGSTDRTEQVARDFGARWAHQEWLGYVAQKNAALALAGYPWLLSVDADEELSDELKREIRVLKKASIPDAVGGFSVPRSVFYEGRWIRHGDWYPDRLVRLFRQDRARFEGGKVHERLIVTGQIKPLHGELYHYSFRDAADHWARCQKYAQLWAESQFETGRKGGSFAPCFHAAFRWLRAYILRAGFLDGRVGWRIAAFSAREVYLKYKLLREKWKSGRN